MSQPGIPEDLLIPIAKAKRVSDKELEALKIALKEDGGENVASQLGISKAAARKRLGEVYKKFEIAGSGPGKLTSLKQKLREQIFGTAADEEADPWKAHLHERMKSSTAQPAVSVTGRSAANGSWLDELPTTSPQLDTHYHLVGTPEISFQNRTRELKELRRWILYPAKSQKLLAICGMGGIGKTYLAVQLAKGLNKCFEQIVWLKIEETETPEFFLEKLLHILQPDNLAGIGQTDRPESVGTSSYQQAIKASGPAEPLVFPPPASAPSEQMDNLIQQFIDCISKQRCLIILDGFERVFKDYDNQEIATEESADETPLRAPTFSASRRHQASVYKQPLKGYRRLLRAVKQPSEQRPSIGPSCVVLTSREKPRELLSLLKGDPMARLYTLSGLSYVEASELLRSFSLPDSQADYEQLICRYRGHPMALRLAADTIKDVFFGRIKDFLGQETFVFDELRSVLKKQFKRLPPIEKEVMYWLVISCKACTLDELKADIVALDHQQSLVYTLQSLERRSLVEIEQGNGVLFSLHPVVRQYVLGRFVRDVFQDLVRGNLDTFNRYALMKAEAEETLRQFQLDHIVQPILHRLKNYFKGLYGVEDHLSTRLDEFRRQHPQRLGYAGGNFINLMVQLSPGQLSDKNFSQLTIWQAYLQGTRLRDVQFNECLIERSAFTETLSDVMVIALSAPPHPSLTLPGQSQPVLAAGDTNGLIHLWQTPEKGYLTAGQKRAEWLAHNGWVRAIAFVPNSSFLVTAGDDSRLKLWQLPTQPAMTQPEQLWQQSAKDWIHAVAVSSDGRMIASGGDNKITLYRTEDGAIISQFPRQASAQPEADRLYSVSTELESNADTVKTGHSRIRALTFSPNGQQLASCGDDYTIRLWSVAALSNEAIRPTSIKLEGHTDWVRTVCFSPDGTKLVSGSEDKRIIVWDTATGCQLKGLDRAGDRVRSVAVSADGQLLAGGGDDAQVMLWNFKTLQYVGSVAAQQSRIWSIAFQQQGEKQLLAAGGDRQTLLLWQVGADRRAIEPVGTPAVQNPLSDCMQQSVPGIQLLKTYRGYANGIRAIAFVGNERIVSGGDSGELSIWDTAGDRKATLPLHQGRIWTLAADTQNALIASAGDDHTIRLWDAETGQCLSALSGHTSWVRAIAFSRSGRLLASCSDDCTIKIWNAASGFCLTTLKQESHWIRAVGFNPESSRYLISGGDDQRVRRWDRQAGTWEALTHHDHRVCSVAYSPDGKIIASGSDDTTVRLWDTAKGEVTHCFTQPELEIKAVAFSPDGRYLAAGGEDQLVYIWDLSAPDPHKRCFVLLPKDSTGRTGGIRSIAFSPNSQFVISGGLDEMIRIGDLRHLEKANQRVLKPLNHRDRPYEGVEIENIKGLSDLRIANLLTLGAISRTQSLLNSP